MGGGPPSSPSRDPPSDHLLVVLPFPEPTAIFNRIRRRFPTLKITYYRLLFTSTPWIPATRVPPEIYATATILVTLSVVPPTPQDCPLLELIHFTSAGTNHVANTPIYKDTDITLTTSSGIHGPQIAEWVLMTALVHSHHYNMLHTWQQERRWGANRGDNEDGVLRRLQDKVGQRLGVLGYGSIGRQVARVAQAMGMDVIAYTARPRETPESKRDHGFIVPGTGDPEGKIPSAWFWGESKQDLARFLAQDIDWLIVSVPLTKETEHMLGETEFHILGKRNAFVSNISRGQILDQQALIRALKSYADYSSSSSTTTTPSSEFLTSTAEELLSHHPRPGLRGAALDVTDPEPLPKDDPLWDAPNCIITPHISGLGAAYVDRCFEVLEVNLERRERGDKLINVVDRRRGY
ncbi:MAG: hypothetical protein Q9190_006872 [Brigantiaea leucoxantha]